MATALITGAGRGLGLAIARAAAGRGLDVIGTVRNLDAATGLRALATESGARVDVRQLDVAAGPSREALVAQLLADGEPLSLLVHNAGVNSRSAGVGSTPEHARLGSLTEEALLATIRTNAIGPLLLTQGLLPLLADGARVVGISSWLGSIAGARDGGNQSYAGSKALLNMYLRLSGNELQRRGVACFLVNPGWVRTDMGGPNASADPAAVAGAILDLTERPGLDLAGRFVDIDGVDHPW